MLTLQGEAVFLRALEPEDLDFIYTIENNEAIWQISNTQTPYSRFILREYLKNSHQDIYTAKQLRLVICKKKCATPIGLIDLFNFDAKNNRAGIGILIEKIENKNKGIGTEVLQLIVKYAFVHLHLHQLYANINADNIPSLQLFTKLGFKKIGVKKQWNRVNNHYIDEILLQHINI